LTGFKVTVSRASFSRGRVLTGWLIPLMVTTMGIKLEEIIKEAQGTKVTGNIVVTIKLNHICFI
jgi:hypothetical protein